MGSKQDHAGVGGEDRPGREESAPLGYQNWKYVMEAKRGRRIQLDVIAESAARGLVAPEDPDVGVGGIGADGRPRSPPLVLLLLRTCHYQRKDSPVEALTLSPEALRVCTMSCTHWSLW